MSWYTKKMEEALNAYNEALEANDEKAAAKALDDYTNYETLEKTNDSTI